MVRPQGGQAGLAGPGRARPGRTVGQTNGPSRAGQVQAGPGADRCAIVPTGPRS